MQGEREVEVLQLTYFGVRGSCDKVRLLMALAGLEYREITVQGKGPADFAGMKHCYEFGQLPQLEDGDVRIVHANAIVRHIARKCNFYGSNAKEAALCDMWLEQLEEVQQALWTADFMKQDCSEYKEAQLKSKFLREYLSEALEGLCRMMAKNKTMYLVGNKMTFVDVVLFSLLETIHREFPAPLACYPLLTYFRDTIKTLPRIASFCNSGRRY